MSFYVRIKRLNGRQDHMELGDWLNKSGIKEVDYHEGGWEDQMIRNSAPHLKFEREEDAVAFILAKGGEFSRSVPEASPDARDYSNG